MKNVALDDLLMRIVGSVVSAIADAAAEEGEELKTEAQLYQVLAATCSDRAALASGLQPRGET